jgi:hypothetical protein
VGSRVTRGSVAGAGVMLTLALALLLPAVGKGEVDPTPSFTIFRLQASNGYDFFALAAPPQEEGEEGLIYLRLARGRHSIATYEAPAMVTRTTIDAELGSLGRISVTRVPTGRSKTVRRGCSPTAKKRVAAERYEGTIEFHGEEGFTEVSATSAPLEPGTVCIRGEEGGGPPGKSLPGARLDVEKRFPNGHGLEFDATQNRPGAKTAVSIEIQEEREELEIYRATSILAGADALRYDRHLRTATVRPPAPFAGYGSFRCNAGRASWSGNLTVDLPGRSNVPIVGSGFRASLEHPHRTGTEPCL